MQNGYSFYSYSVYNYSFNSASAGPSSLGMRTWLTAKTHASPHAEFDVCWSHGTSIVTEISRKNQTLRVLPFKSLKVIGNDTDRSATCDFLSVSFYHGPIPFQSQTAITAENANFSYPIFNAAVENVTLGTLQRRLIGWTNRWRKTFDVCIPLDSIPQRDEQTERGTEMSYQSRCAWQYMLTFE